MKKLFAGPIAIVAWAVSAHSAPAAEAGHACLIEPYQKIELRSPVEALIAAIHVHRGSTVQKGQVLVELESATERATLEVARYRAVMEGQVQTAESRLQAGKEKLRRREELLQEHFIAAQDRDDAKTEVQVAEASLLEARDNRRLAALEQRRLSELLEQRRLRSPFSGVVTDRMQQVGEIAQTGESARPILKLAQTNPLRVEAVLPLSMYGRLKLGAKADVAVEAPLTGRYTATVSIVDSVVDSASGTFGVRLDLPNPRGEVPAGVKCRVTFQ